MKPTNILTVLLLSLALSVPVLALDTSNAVETVNLKDLGLQKTSRYASARTVNGKEPSIGGQTQPNAFMTLGNTLIAYNLKGQAQRLTGKVGIDDLVAKRFTESVEVLVYGDNKKLWASGPLKSGQPPVSMGVDLKGVKQLELVADFAGDQYEDAQVAFADMAISYSGFRPEAVYPPKTAKADPNSIFISPKGPETPRITGGRVFGVRPGSAFLFTVTASGRKPMTFSARNLPPGLQLDSQTGQITGCLQTKGEHRVLVSARNELGAAERELKIVVGDQLSLSPPMGWSSWNVWLKQVDQSKVEKAAELMVCTGLKDHGYLYVNIDDGWQGERGGKDNALQANEKFPDMKGLCDKIHKQGLKAGIYSTPWMTSYGKFPGSTAATPDGKWSKDKIEFKVGPCSFLKQDARQWAQWGFDYCKWDWHFHKPNEINAVSEALKESGRDMLCGLSNRGVFEHAQAYVKHANSWRTTNDLLGHWEHLQTIGFAQNRWAEFGGPGHWLDMDSLICGFAWGKPTGMTPDEQYLQMSMWALMSAPLWLSCDFEKMDEFTLRLLTNDEVLDIDQDPLGKPARRTWTRGQLEVWVKDLEDGSKAVGFFNRSREPLAATIDLKSLGLDGKYLVRDLWKRADVGSVDKTITVSPPPHGVQLYKMTPALQGAATRSGAGVEFSSSNPLLQRVFDGIIRANRKNEERMKDGRRVLVEGDIWRAIWLETQPMGGSMYGKFDLEIAKNNLEVVIDGQLANGQLPHVTQLDGKQWNGAIGFNAVAQYGLDAYYLFKKDPAFLDKLENALTRYDAFLWKNRDRNGNGVLEAYGTTDTGEDGQAGNRYDLPRDSDGKRFVESVSVTADSYANRAVLAQIAAIKGDEAKRLEWQAKADALQKRAREYFWVEERKAAFDRNSQGEILPTLNQLNIRAMAQGLFTQQMAEDFVRCHLMNPQEFFTPYPIPSTAINDPKFINVEKSTEYASWAGPSQGLTLQRSVKALENYGLYVEIGLIGERLLNRIGREPVRFPVQFNPVTGDTVARAGSYGPMVLASMEFLSRMYGVYVYRESVAWNGLPGGGNLEYKQTWNQNEYRLVNRDGRVSGFLNGSKLFEVPAGLRVETDYEGNVKRIAGLAPKKVSGPLLLGKTEVAEFVISPNQVRSFPQSSESH